MGLPPSHSQSSDGRRQRTACPWKLPDWHENTDTALGRFGAARSSFSSSQGGSAPGSPAWRPSALQTDQWGGGPVEMSQGGWPWHGAGLSRPAQGRAPGGARAWPSLARRARTRPGQLSPGRSGPVMTPGPGGARRPRGGGRSRPTPSPRAPARPRPTAGCYLLLQSLREGPGTSEARRAAQARPLPASESRERSSALGPGARGRRQRGTRPARWGCERGGQCGPRASRLCEWDKAARAWPSVYVCACQSTLTGRSPLARPRPPRRPPPPPIGRFEHKGPRLAPPAACAPRAGRAQLRVCAWVARAWGRRLGAGALTWTGKAGALPGLTAHLTLGPVVQNTLGLPHAPHPTQILGF